MKQIRGVLLDIDGTLVKSNDVQAQAWVEAMREHGFSVDVERVGPLIGMGGDKVLPEVLGIDKNSDLGKQISARRKEFVLTEGIKRIKALPGAAELLQRMHEQGLKMVIATSAEQDELRALLHIIGPHVEELFADQISAQDAQRSKPSPDTVALALQRTGYPADEVLMIGDTRYDIEAAAKAGVKSLAFRSGGWSDEDLRGAIAIYDGPADLLAHYDDSPLVKGV